MSLDGLPLLLIDTAGLRDGHDPVEQIGVARAGEAIGNADIILWLGDSDDAPESPALIRIGAKTDLAEFSTSPVDVAVSARTGEGMVELRAMLKERALSLLPRGSEVATNARQRAALLMRRRG